MRPRALPTLMFDIGWSELLVIVVVAIVVVGPKDLPKLMRTFGHYAGKVRRAASDFQRQFEQVMHESELDEVRKNIKRIHDHTSSFDLNAPVDRPVMFPKPKPQREPEAGASPSAKPAAKPRQAPKRALASAKVATKAPRKTPSAKPSKKKTEPAP